MCVCYAGLDGADFTYICIYIIYICLYVMCVCYAGLDGAGSICMYKICILCAKPSVFLFVFPPSPGTLKDLGVHFLLLGLSPFSAEVNKTGA